MPNDPLDEVGVEMVMDDYRNIFFHNLLVF
jgi:hypothetical protein